MEKPLALIIDDEADIRLLLSRRLSMLGFRVQTAALIREGIELIGKSDAQIIFLDLNLPDGSGFSLLSEIRQLHPACKVVMISAYDGANEQNRARLEGADLFLSKPFSKATLENALLDFGFIA